MQEKIPALIEAAKLAVFRTQDYTQTQRDRLAQALAWFSGNEETFAQIARFGVDESGIGDRQGRVGKRFKIQGVLRDVLRQKSVGLVEEIPQKGLAKYAKPVGVIASIVPMTNPALTPAVTAVYAAKSGNAVIFSPHPRSQRTTEAMVEVLREACRYCNAPADLFQILLPPTKETTNTLMQGCDLVLATGGSAMVKAAYSSGRPAYGVGAGNSTMIIDESADIAQAAFNTRVSKTSDFGSGCSADGNVIIHEGIYAQMLEALKKEGGYLCSPKEKELLRKVLWNEKGARRFETIACTPQKIATLAGFSVSDSCRFIMVDNQAEIGKREKFSGEKLTTVMSLYRFENFGQALEILATLYQVGGKGHSCGIYSHNEQNIDALACFAPVSRIMVRQAQSKANAGAFTNGMPMTSSLGCGIWGGNITNENIHLKHFLNYTWVSKPLAEDRPSEKELFGEFYQIQPLLPLKGVSA